MSKKSYAQPSLTSERIFKESSKRCVYANDTMDNFICKKHTGCDYSSIIGYCSIWPVDS
jgi:hypothetical protein